LNIEVGEAEKWDQGCQGDSIRNQFIIPSIARQLNNLQRQNILDVGCATGYIIRHVQSKLNYTPKWTCIDSNISRIEFAKKLDTDLKNINYIAGEFLKFEFDRIHFDAIMFSFTLLELGLDESVLHKISELSSGGSKLFVVLPDAWGDVLHSEDEPLRLGREFLAGALTLHKIDKFTGKNYPFKALRIESVISDVLSLDFVLERLERYDLESRSIFLLTFDRKPADGCL
jgi:SAM-dependent methyltransferase